jgi:hypothetical protein
MRRPPSPAATISLAKVSRPSGASGTDAHSTDMRDLEAGLAPLPYVATVRVAEVIAALGRTEDVRFSPGNRRLAVAAFHHNRIAVFDVEVSRGPDSTPQVALTGGAQLTSDALKQPHGIDFLDESTLAVTSRAGGVTLMVLPPGSPDLPTCDQQPAQTWPAGENSLFQAPGSIAVAPLPDRRSELLICDNNGHSVSRHLLEWRNGGAEVIKREVLISNWLDVPDGIAVSPDGRWMAVSNHNPHNVLLYDRSASVDAASAPDGILRRVLYPHGLRFSPDGRHIVVADAGAPYLHVYRPGAHGWRGVHEPESFRVMDQVAFGKGNNNPQEGGPKGVDIDHGGQAIVVTSEHQPLAFFDLRLLLESTSQALKNVALDLQAEMCLMDEQRALKAQLCEVRSSVGYMHNSLSWRVTAPLRRLHALWQAVAQGKSS